MAFTCKYTKEELKNLGMVELCEILEENEVQYDNLETEEEIRELVVKNVSLDKTSNDQEKNNHVMQNDKEMHRSSTRSGADLMNTIIAKDLVKKNELCKIYEALQEFFERRQVDTELLQELETAFQNFNETLKRHPMDLKTDECPLVVAGETSAGKSSILNLLLGSEILPHSLLCSTSTICRLRNSDVKRVEVTEVGKTIPKKLNIDESTDGKSLKSILQNYVSVDQNRMNNPYEYVDIYWPVPMLKKHVIVVDTPGIGEDPRMTQRLLKYLPKAVGFIYVINSANAGGVQSDRLLKIFEYLHAEELKGKSTFDHRCAIFICNKWDQVSESEEEKVWKDTCAKLKSSWPMFDEKTQLFKMSALEVSRRLSGGLGITDKYDKFLHAIEKIIPSSLEAKVMRHVFWLKKFLKRLMYLIVARINASKQTAEEKERKKCEVEERIKILKEDMKRVKDEVSDEANTKCRDLAQSLNEHLMNPETRNKMIKWPPTDQLPEGSDMEVIKYKAVKLIQGLIESEIFRWCQRSQITKVTSMLTESFKEKCKLLQEQCDSIDNVILGAGQPLDVLPEVEMKENQSIWKRESLFTRQEKIAMAIFSPLFLPLVVAAGIIALPVGVGVAIRDAILDRKRVTRYRENKIDHLSGWVDEVLSQYTADSIFESLEKSYLCNFNELLEYLCEEEIPQQIKVDTQLITHITNDIRESEKIRQVYQPLERACKVIQGQFLYLLMEHFEVNKIEKKNVRKGEEIAAGSYSSVYFAEVLFNQKWEVAALKEMRHPLEDEQMHSQLTEVKNLLKFKHKNIVELYGVSFKESTRCSIKEGTRRKHLQMIMELCDETLENHVIVSKDNNVKPCSSFKLDSVDIVIPLRFYCKITLDICHGLEYIHNLKFIHRDLKLSNVLMKNGVAKIADVGFSKPVDMLTGSVIGTPTHMAPEVLQGKLYTQAADIYSLAIMLWEIWYGKRAYSGPEYSQMQQYHSLACHVKDGTRPGFVKYKPWPNLEIMIQKCWNVNPEARRTIADIKNLIFEIKDQKCKIQDIHM